MDNFKTLLGHLGIHPLRTSSEAFYCLNEEIMSKRRNLKKEKSERNKAYARKFRKTSTRRFSGKRSYNRSNSQDNQESAESSDS